MRPAPASLDRVAVVLLEARVPGRAAGAIAVEKPHLEGAYAARKCDPGRRAVRVVKCDRGAADGAAVEAIKRGHVPSRKTVVGLAAAREAREIVVDRRAVAAA